MFLILHGITEYGTRDFAFCTGPRDKPESRTIPGPGESLASSVFHQNQRGLTLDEYEPQLARKTIVHPAQNRHYSSNARGSHPHGYPTGVGLTRRQVSVPWGVKSVINSSRYNAQRDKSLRYCRQRARSVGRLGAVILSTRRRETQKLTAPSASSDDLSMALGKTLLSFVRSRVVAQLERCGCPILHTPVPKFQRFPE